MRSKRSLCLDSDHLYFLFCISSRLNCNSYLYLCLKCTFTASAVVNKLYIHSHSSYVVGIGAASCVIMGLINIYYNVILAWAFHYLFASFTSELPWSTCNNAWNTPNCRGGVGPDNTSLSVPGPQLNSTPAAANVTRTIAGLLYSNGNSSRTDPITEYWE